MLRINICPALGLSNGAGGKLVALVYGDEKTPPHETLNGVFERVCTNKTPSIPSLLVTLPKNCRGIIGALDYTGSLPDTNGHTVLIDPHTFRGFRGFLFLSHTLFLCTRLNP